MILRPEIKLLTTPFSLGAFALSSGSLGSSWTQTQLRLKLHVFRIPTPAYLDSPRNLQVHQVEGCYGILFVFVLRESEAT